MRMPIAEARRRSAPDLAADLAPDLAADLAACRAMLRDGSRSFHVASKVLPRRVAEPAAALYAFCRLADDAVDLPSKATQGDAGLALASLPRSTEGEAAAASPADGAARRAALARLRKRLARAYDGRPLDIAADRAFADVVARHGIPRALPEALLEGLEWDAGGRRYDTLADVEAYAARVAGSVGAMMAVLMGARDAAAIARACDLGVAMQLSNIARDVGEDARMGRLYLPRDWLVEAGIDPAGFLAAPRFTPALGRVVLRLLAHAEALYARAEAGIARLPRDCRPGIGAARLIYAEIGRRVAATGGDSVSARAVVPGRRKAALLARGFGAIAWPAGQSAPPLEATRFLVDAVLAAPPAPQPDRYLGQRAVWVCALFADLRQRDLTPRYPMLAEPAA